MEQKKKLYNENKLQQQFGVWWRSCFKSLGMKWITYYIPWNSWGKKLDTCLTPYSKINVRCIKGLNIKKKKQKNSIKRFRNLIWRLLLFLLFSCEVVSDSYNPMDYSPPGSSVHGISQARILEWVTISFCRGSSGSRDQTRFSGIGRWVLNNWAT